jgi:hypothetical protein
MTTLRYFTLLEYDDGADVWRRKNKLMNKKIVRKKTSVLRWKQRVIKQSLIGFFNIMFDIWLRTFVLLDPTIYTNWSPPYYSFVNQINWFQLSHDVIFSLIRSTFRKTQLERAVRLTLLFTCTNTQYRTRDHLYYWSKSKIHKFNRSSFIKSGFEFRQSKKTKKRKYRRKNNPFCSVLLCDMLRFLFINRFSI